MKNRAEKIYIFTKNISLKFDFKVLIIKFSATEVIYTRFNIFFGISISVFNHFQIII